MADPTNHEALLRVVRVEAMHDELSRRVDRFELSTKDTLERIEQTVVVAAKDIRDLAVAQGEFRANHEASDGNKLQRAIQVYLPHIALGSGAGFLGWLFGVGGKH